ncbi:MAG: prepilin-type N-terminal cleavage/methylation domain-containing protein, partial [Verrucomicrobiota bacterium]
MTDFLSAKHLQTCRGLTLVELLVVLTILAVLSTVALRSVAQITEEKRYEANRSQLETVEAAVLGET